MFSVEVNSVSFEAALQRLKKAVRQGIVDPQTGSLAVQGRLLAERAAQFTPPQNKQQGQAAVARDLQRVFYPVSHTTFTDKSLRRIVQRDDRRAWDIVSPKLSASTGLRNTRAVGFDKMLHRQRRHSRGRVGAGRNFGTVTLGPEARKSRAYAKDKKAMVGWARAGWSAGIVGLGGVVRTAWVSRHGAGHGRLIDARATADPYIEVINSSSWARYRGKEGQRILQNAATARARDIQRFVELSAKRAAAQAGLLPTAA